MIITIEPYPATLKAIEKRLTDLGKGDSMRMVLKKAVNEAADEGKRQIYTGVRQTYTIKGFSRGDIVKRAYTNKHAGAALTVKGETLPVFQYYQRRANKGKYAAKLKILRSAAVKELKMQNGGSMYKAFVTVMESGHKGIFQRVPGSYMKKHRPGNGSKGREAIKEILSLSKAKAAEVVYENENMYAELQEEISFRLLKHMNAVIGE